LIFYRPNVTELRIRRPESDRMKRLNVHLYGINSTIVGFKLH